MQRNVTLGKEGLGTLWNACGLRYPNRRIRKDVGNMKLEPFFLKLQWSRVCLEIGFVMRLEGKTWASWRNTSVKIH